MRYLLITVTLLVGYATYDHSFTVMTDAIDARTKYIEETTR